MLWEICIPYRFYRNMNVRNVGYVCNVGHFDSDSSHQPLVAISIKKVECFLHFSILHMVKSQPGWIRDAFSFVCGSLVWLSGLLILVHPLSHIK